MWLVLSLLVALLTAVRTIISKRLLGQELNLYLLGGAQFTISGILLAIVISIVGMPSIAGSVYMSVAISLVLNIVATVFLFKSLKFGDLSLVTPLGTFLPVFLLGTSYVILGEVPTILGACGIFLVVLGSYVLHWDKALEAPHTIFVRIIKHKASLYMIAVAFLWSISANFDKIGSRDSSPIFYSALLDIILGLSLLAIGVLMRRNPIRQIPKHSIPWLFLLGVLFAVFTVANFTAFTLTNISYVSAVHYLSTALTVLYGVTFLNEKSGMWRSVGAAVMVVGVVLIAL